MSSRWGMPCIAIRANGRPCGNGHRVEVPVTFAWDPVRGVGIAGPSLTLCRMHDYLWSLEPHERIEVIGGWHGRVWNHEAGVWTVLQSVFVDRTSHEYAPRWWALRRVSRFGVCDERTWHTANAAALAAEVGA